MKRGMIWALAACLLLMGCGGQATETGDHGITAAPIEGEALSPDGRLEVRLAGENTGVTAAGLYPAESVQIVDTDTGEVLWEDMGYYRHAVLWSPEGRYAAISRQDRTCGIVTVVDTTGWTSCDVPLPDGSGPGEYSNLSAVEWTDEDTLSLQYRDTREDGETVMLLSCTLQMAGAGWITASSQLALPAAEVLPGMWDFDHDGEPETVTLTGDGDSMEHSTFWVLGVLDGGGAELWSDSAASAHVGWNSLFACTLDGRDYLLRYHPTMFHGWCNYAYQMFSLGEGGEELVFRENSADFDINFNAASGHSFDAAAIADFLWEVRGFLEDSTLLLSSEDGDFQSNVPGLELRYYPFGELLALDTKAGLEAAVRQREAAWREEMGA